MVYPVVAHLQYLITIFDIGQPQKELKACGEGIGPLTEHGMIDIHPMVGVEVFEWLSSIITLFRFYDVHTVPPQLPKY